MRDGSNIDTSKQKAKILIERVSTFCVIQNNPYAACYAISAGEAMHKVIRLCGKCSKTL